MIKDSGGPAEVPAVVLASGEKADLRFIEFFAANIWNPNTRRPYHRAVCAFFAGANPDGLGWSRSVRCTSQLTSRKFQESLAWPGSSSSSQAIRMLFELLQGAFSGDSVPSGFYKSEPTQNPSDKYYWILIIRLNQLLFNCFQTSTRAPLPQRFCAYPL